MHPVAERELESVREAVAGLCRRFGVSRLSLFGSAAGDNFDPARSDFDFLVEYGAPPEEGWLFQYTMFPEALAELLGRRVDVVEANSLARKNKWFRAEVEESLRTFYAA